VSVFLEQLLDRLAPDLARLALARHPDPAALLGAHRHGARTVVLVLLPGAVHARLNRRRDLIRWRDSALFGWCGRAEGLPERYVISWEDAAGEFHETHDPYSFGLIGSSAAVARFVGGSDADAGSLFGAEPQRLHGIEGVRFATYAPAAASVGLVLGRTRRWPMRPLGSSGAWELFLPGVLPGTRYRFDIESRANGAVVRKTDPFGKQFEPRPRRAALVANPAPFTWRDARWLQGRARAQAPSAPLSICQVHLGSWRRPGARFANYRALAPELARHVAALGATHVELLPITEYPDDASWGYRATGYFAPTARYGSADDFRAFVDHLHGAGIGVILDWVPGPFAAEEHGLACYDGSALFEHADPRRGRDPATGAPVFDLGRPLVRAFLLASARRWLANFHLDGLCIRGVAALLYLDYGRAAGEWLPNAEGRPEHDEAIAFLRKLNQALRREFPGIVTIAEESSGWSGVTAAVAAGGLGFDLKWNTRFTRASLGYFGRDPIYRRHHHAQLSACVERAFDERQVLALADETVAHGQGSLLSRLPGDRWQRFANLRLLYAWQWMLPGKKLIFMGAEFAEPTRQDPQRELSWELLESPVHAGVMRLVGDLNRLYRETPALYALDQDVEGFAWLEREDALRSLIAFERRAGDDIAVVALNFTPVPRIGYRLGFPLAGAWREVLNTDAACYGGSNVGNLSRVEAVRDPAMGRRYSASVTLPPLAAVVFVPGGP
jgi:1,4-alpha-glucan branching enzyme